MKTNTLLFERCRAEGHGSAILILTISLLLGLVANVSAAGKGKPNLTRATWIDVQFTFDDSLDYGLVSDGAPYVHDQDYVSAQLGTVENINLVLNTKFRKEPIRHFWLQGDPFEALTEVDLKGLPAPDFPSGVVPKAMFQICGEDLDELVAVTTVQVRLMLDDESGHAWEVSYLGTLTRNSTTEWGFEAETGVLYGYPEGAGPDGPIEIGAVNLPLSGVIEPLAN